MDKDLEKKLEDILKGQDVIVENQEAILEDISVLQQTSEDIVEKLENLNLNVDEGDFQ